MILAVNVSSINCLSIAYLSIKWHYTVIHLSELHPVNICFWNVGSLSCLPAILKSLSIAKNGVETVRSSNASLLKLEKTFTFAYQYWRGSLLWSIVGWLQRAHQNDPMLADCWVIINDVDPQLRKRLVFAGCSTGRCKKHPPPCF